MALFIRQSEDRSKLQERLSAELQERHKQRNVGNNEPEKIEDTAYLKDTTDTGSLTWLWVALMLIAAGVIGYFLYQSILQ